MKWIAFDFANERFRREHRRYLEQLRRDVSAWDALVSPKSFSTDVLRRAFEYDGPILETGYPCNDLLLSPEAATVRDTVRAELGIEPGAPCLLYAPTWRDDSHFTLHIDLAAFARALPDAVLLLRTHPLVKSDVDLDPSPRVRDVAGRSDIRELFLAADVLVTDYSSVMFDFAVTGKPMLFFTYDLEAYRDELRGFYFDFANEAPGPLLPTSGDLIAALQSLPDVEAALSRGVWPVPRALLPSRRRTVSAPGDRCPAGRARGHAVLDARHATGGSSGWTRGSPRCSQRRTKASSPGQRWEEGGRIVTPPACMASPGTQIRLRRRM